jgi:26S proteasome regulatory subunit T6
MKKEGIKSYYQAKIEECEIVMNEKSQDLRRLEAQRNALNAKGKINILPLIYLCNKTKYNL